MNKKLRVRNAMSFVTKMPILERDKEDEQKARRRSQSYVEDFLRNPTKSQPKIGICSRSSLRYSLLTFFLTLTMLITSCAGRLPSPSRTQGMLEHFFKKYSRKYPATPYGQNGVKKVEVERQTEIRKKFAAVEAYVTLGDGSLKKINATVEKGPLGWRFVSWEDATGL